MFIPAVIKDLSTLLISEIELSFLPFSIIELLNAVFLLQFRSLNPLDFSSSLCRIKILFF
jgi:hypothetical protein